MRISDWSSDVCSSDLVDDADRHALIGTEGEILDAALGLRAPIGAGGHFDGADAVCFGAGIAQVGHSLKWPECRQSGAARSDRKSVVVGKEGVRTFRSRWSPSH